MTSLMKRRTRLRLTNSIAVGGLELENWDVDVAVGNGVGAREGGFDGTGIGKAVGNGDECICL